MSSIASLSALYQETKEIDGSAELFAPIAANPVIQALAVEGVCKEELYRFTLSCVRGAIHPALKPFSVGQLVAAKETIEYWQFPTIWVSAIDEEIAFRSFQATNTLPPILQDVAEQISTIYTFSAPTHRQKCSVESIFSTSTGGVIDIYFGRKKFGKNILDTSVHIDFLARALAHSHWEIVEMLLAKGLNLSDERYLRLYKLSVAKGNVDAIRWIHTHGNPPFYDNLVDRYDATMTTIDIIYTAIQYGQLEILKILIEENGMPIACLTSSIIKYAVGCSQIAILDYFNTILPPDIFRNWSEYLWEGLTSSNDVAGIEWLITNGHLTPTSPFNPLMEYYTLKNISLPMLALLRSNGFPWSTKTTRIAALNPNPAILRWLLENGCPIDEHFAVCFINGKATIEHLKLLDEFHVPLDADNLYIAIFSGYGEPVSTPINWLQKKKLPISQKAYDECVFLHDQYTEQPKYKDAFLLKLKNLIV